jgi:hypothetical protein
MNAEGGGCSRRQNCKLGFGGLASPLKLNVQFVRYEPPTLPRRVGGGRRNVCGRYPSRKMGVTIQFESHRVELAEVYVMEHAAACLEYYDQPPRTKLEYQPGLHPRVEHERTREQLARRVVAGGRALGI